MDAATKIGFLLRPESQALLEILDKDPRDELALAGSPLLKKLKAPERIALLEQRALRKRGLRKNPRANELVFTALGLEQMTSAALGVHKAKRFESGYAVVGDLCCGLGGDSFYLPASIKVVGVDQSDAAILAYQHNVNRFRKGFAVKANALQLSVKIDAAIIDPARRKSLSRNAWGDEELEPGLGQLEELSKRVPALAIKLGPGLHLPEAFHNAEVEYLGLRDECLECVVWMGPLGQKGLVRATELPGGETLSAYREDIEADYSDAQEPGRYLYEPVKCVIRAHLHGVLAANLGLWKVDPAVAYLASDTSIDSPLLKRYQIESELPFDLKVIRAAMRKDDVGRIEIKKRGLTLTPEVIRPQIVCAGGQNETTLIFTKLKGSKRVFRVKPELGQNTVETKLD